MNHSSKMAINVIQSNYDSAITGLSGSVRSLSAAFEVDPNKPFDEALILSNIQDIVKANKAYNNVILANLSGEAFTVAAKGWEKDFNAITGNREWFTSIIQDKKDSNISNPYKSILGIYEMTASAPLMFNNKVVGVLALDVNLNTLIPDSGVEFALTTQSGQIVAIDSSSPVDFLNQNLFEIRPNFKDVADSPMFIDAGNDEYFSLTKLPLSHGVIGYIFTNQTITFGNAQDIQTTLISVLI
ncbi:PDC sensor domain-containing protein, partial [Aliivibrio fischeri]|uniref:PDC sensor domain-containing protein n=1 Tax=Aliivibrio fischeri TaxID=668 RepID=UPI002350DCB5